MMKLAVAALLAGSAAAFAPAQTGRVATDLAVSELEVRLLHRREERVSKLYERLPEV